MAVGLGRLPQVLGGPGLAPGTGFFSSSGVGGGDCPVNESTHEHLLCVENVTRVLNKARSHECGSLISLLYSIYHMKLYNLQLPSHRETPPQKKKIHSQYFTKWMLPVELA